MSEVRLFKLPASRFSSPTLFVLTLLTTGAVGLILAVSILFVVGWPKVAPASAQADGWTEPEVLLAAGTPTPAGGTFSRFLEVHINNRGHVAFSATIDGAGEVTQGIFILNSGVISKVAVVGDDSPIGAAIWRFGCSFGFNDDDAVVFEAEFADRTGAVLLAWGDSVVKVVAAGEPTPLGGTYASRFTCTDWGLGDGRLNAGLDLNNMGDVAFGTKIDGGQATGAMFIWSRGIVTPVVAVGNPKPEGGVFDYPGYNRITESGHLVFRNFGSSGSADALYAWNGSDFRRFVGASDAIPGGGTLRYVCNFDVAGNDLSAKVVLQAKYWFDSTERFAVLAVGAAGLEKIVDSGDPLPGGGSYGPTSCGQPVSVNSQGRIVLRTNSEGRWRLYGHAESRLDLLDDEWPYGNPDMNEHTEVAYTNFDNDEIRLVRYLAPTPTPTPPPPETGTVLAHKFEDTNENGIQDAGEADLSGWTMTLYYKTRCKGDAVSSGATGPDGNVSFEGLTPGWYSVEEASDGEWMPTTPSCQRLLLESGQSKAVDFGNKRKEKRDVVFIQGIDSRSDCDGTYFWATRAPAWVVPYLTSESWITNKIELGSLLYFSYKETTDCQNGQPEYEKEDTCDGVEKAAGELRDFIDERASARVTIVGHSMGGLVAAYLVATEPQEWVESHVASVVTFDSPLRGLPVQNLMALDLISVCNLDDDPPAPSLTDMWAESLVVESSSNAATIVPFYTLDASHRELGLGEAVPGDSTSLDGERMHWRFNQTHTNIWDNSKPPRKAQVVGCAVIVAENWKDCRAAMH